MKNFESMIKKQQKKKKYKFKNLTTKHLFFYPFMILWYYIEKICFKIKKIINNNIKWNIKRTNKILTYCLSKKLQQDEENNFTGWFNTFFLNWKKSCKLIDKKYCSKYKYEIWEYLLNNFEINGYIKKIEQDKYDNWLYYIKFQKIK